MEPAKLNGVDPQTWLAYVLGRIADHKINRIDSCSPGDTVRVVEPIRVSDPHSATGHEHNADLLFS